ncbi:helix-turn-helix transcriptional regulator [Ponticoccus sp. SC2-23]|uniref:helix-turn-helix domain-containing protein n=1 Tax=Alexandriicola marinus TaxID=2081710 RepID=UPI000FD85080|nr:helix-turn-helix transcriptional regulator [Alexandriicola marinus]MBM1222929.1 helix-turn-helix transcriptional regulator [Ponticoccus sp. SC6-9]MBM1227338.1 helix-turn-helix transcriptional regulator [Ponticoccus sp. SC6-15]MBM1231841.1 helix-turn-helix transcriptional regulator [Ponticoccus sp. SC6-38]MBM1236371.1 helix-turn-helix transcriptional regulator [Ponticoccus sp. SC6-45]MBM1240877.1 helix-turn-helix transcriptional regulator [Ponticoccus sp. SC6-49]MBM1245403.1 helix-turn-heli
MASMYFLPVKSRKWSLTRVGGEIRSAQGEHAGLESSLVDDAYDMDFSLDELFSDPDIIDYKAGVKWWNENREHLTRVIIEKASDCVGEDGFDLSTLEDTLRNAIRSIWPDVPTDEVLWLLSEEDSVRSFFKKFDDIQKDMYSFNPLPKLAEGSEALINDDQIKSGKLSRDFMASVLAVAMDRQNLTDRELAKLANVSTNTIQQIKNSRGSIDKALAILETLGYRFDCSVTGPEEPS